MKNYKISTNKNDKNNRIRFCAVNNLEQKSLSDAICCLSFNCGAMGVGSSDKIAVLPRYE